MFKLVFIYYKIINKLRFLKIIIKIDLRKRNSAKFYFACLSKTWPLEYKLEVRPAL